MAFGVTSTTGLDTLWRGTRGVLAVLLARADTRDLAPAWKEMADRINAVRTKRDDLELATAIARAETRVADADLDLVLGDLHHRADDLGGRKPNGEPRRVLFGSLSRTEVLRLGAAKVTVLSSGILMKLSNLPALADFRGRLQEKADTLEQKAKARTRAEQAEAALTVERLALINEVETLAFNTEAQLLQRFVGQRALVRALVTVVDVPERKRKTASEPEDEALTEEATE